MTLYNSFKSMSTENPLLQVSQFIAHRFISFNNYMYFIYNLEFNGKKHVFMSRYICIYLLKNILLLTCFSVQNHHTLLRQQRLLHSLPPLPAPLLPQPLPEQPHGQPLLLIQPRLDHDLIAGKKVHITNKCKDNYICCVYTYSAK